MKPEQIYQHLKEIAEKLNIELSEENLKKSGLRVQSGFCRIKDRDKFIMDKHLSIHDKNSILAAFISEIAHDDIYIVPAVREYIQNNASYLEKLKTRQDDAHH